MALELETRKMGCEDVWKCGEITTLLALGKQEFFLNCGFCDYTFLQLESFIQHISDKHLPEFPIPKLKKEASELSPDIQKEIENIAAAMESENEDNAEESDDNTIHLRGFERVEIELEMNQSMDVKEELMSDGFMSECSIGSINYDDSNDVTLAEKVDGETDSDSETVAGLQAFDEANMFHKKALLSILSSYEKHPALWDREVRLQTSSTKKEQIFKSIAHDVGMPTEWESIRKLIRKLSARLHSELIRKRLYESNGKKYTAAWYEDLNAFLKPRRQSCQGKPRSAVKKLIIPDTLLSDAQCLILAQIYKDMPGLWDETDITYRFSNRRREALRVIREEFNNKSGLCLTQSDVENEITRLRKICSNEKKEKIICKRKNLVYKPECHYYDHISFLEVDVTPYECSICDEVVSGPCQYKVHLSSHDGTLPFKCHVCGRGFKLVTNLTVHLRRHAHDYTYTCEVCNKTYATNTDLKIHMRCHTGEMPYICDICGNKFRTASLFSTHMQRHANRPRHKCDICSKGFYKKGLLREHMTVHIKVRDKICSVCNKGFTSLKQLRQHQHIHDEEKKYLCKICGKRFAQHAGLSGHMKSHGTMIGSITTKSADL